MSWTKLSDDFPDRHMGLSDAAFRLHVAATVYANRLSLDGMIPKARLSLLPVPQRTRRPAVVRELVAAGLWAEGGIVVERRDGYPILRLDHSNVWTLLDFPEAQLSSEEVKAQRAYDAVRQRVRFAGDADAKADLREEESKRKRELFEAREERREWASLVLGRIPAPATTPNVPFRAPLVTDSGASDDTKRPVSRAAQDVSNTGSFDAREREHEGASLVSHNATHYAPASPVPVPPRPVPTEDEGEGEVGRTADRALRALPAAGHEREEPLLSCPECGERIVNPDDARMTTLNDTWMIEHVGCRAAREAATVVR